MSLDFTIQGLIFYVGIFPSEFLVDNLVTIM